jgi:hypothetical protein
MASTAPFISVLPLGFEGDRKYAAGGPQRINGLRRVNRNRHAAAGTISSPFDQTLLHRADETSAPLAGFLVPKNPNLLSLSPASPQTERRGRKETRCGAKLRQTMGARGACKFRRDERSAPPGTRAAGLSAARARRGKGWLERCYRAAACERREKVMKRPCHCRSGARCHRRPSRACIVQICRAGIRTLILTWRPRQSTIRCPAIRERAGTILGNA